MHINKTSLREYEEAGAVNTDQDALEFLKCGW